MFQIIIVDTIILPKTSAHGKRASINNLEALVGVSIESLTASG
jgi:hypothetical protein